MNFRRQRAVRRLYDFSANKAIEKTKVNEAELLSQNGYANDSRNG
jgi:hypothetical protein